jgi:hypothetical protein
MYEVGKREPDFETEEKIADFFNTDLNTLRGYDTEIGSNCSYINDSDEKTMMSKYRLLNNEGKRKLIERADELLTLGYIKEDMEKMA